MNNDKLVKTLIKYHLKEYWEIKKLYEKHKAGKLNPKKTTELKEKLKIIKKKINYLIEQMTEKIKAIEEIKDYDKEIYEQYINLKGVLEAINDEMSQIDKEINGGENGGTTAQA